MHACRHFRTHKHTSHVKSVNKKEKKSEYFFVYIVTGVQSGSGPRCDGGSWSQCEHTQTRCHNSCGDAGQMLLHY